MLLRDQIIHESYSLVADGGLEALSIRAVAQRCQVSIGAVQHHFPTKALLLITLVDVIGEELTGTVAKVDSCPTTEDARTPLIVLAEFLGGVVDDAPIHIKAWLAFLTHGIADEEVANRHRELWHMLETALSTRLQQLGVDANRSSDNAALLLAALDGIAVARALEPARMPVDRCRKLVHQAVENATQ